jgi:hypothetical protein
MASHILHFEFCILHFDFGKRRCVGWQIGMKNEKRESQTGLPPRIDLNAISRPPRS